MPDILYSPIKDLHNPLSKEELFLIPGNWGEEFKRFSPWKKSVCGRYLKSSLSKEKPRILIAGRVSSVLDLAKETDIADELFEWDSIIAVNQASGRGRLGRVWKSETGDIAAALRIPNPPEEYKSLLSVLIGDIAASYITSRGIPTLVKWPNDLIAGGGKVGGILLEERAGVINAGIGVNVTGPSDMYLEEKGIFPPRSLSSFKKTIPGPLQFWSQLVKNFQKKYNELISKLKPEEYTEDFSRRMALLGENVRATTPSGESISGSILGIAPDGALRIRNSAGREERFLNAELSLPLQRIT